MASSGGSSSPRRVGSTITSPKLLRTEQPKSPLKPPPPTRLLRPRRRSKSPEPDAPPAKTLPSPPPKPEYPPGLATEEEPPATEAPPTPDAPTSTDVYEEEEPEEEKRSDAFDDKEVDLPEDDKRIDRIHEPPHPPSGEPPGLDPPPEIDPIVEKAGACETIPPRSELGSSRASRSIPKLGAFPDLGRSEENEVEVKGRSMQEAENSMQRIVDLVMWRDVSRSALVFGMGTFFFVSSSYTGDLHLSFVSVVSYVGLFYLAGIFLLNSILRRGEVDFGESKQTWLVGEDEALWVVGLLLPYVNEILTKLRALFSGDPSTTMKMAMLLFALARCGGSITIWTVGKLAFFGMFTIPRLCASYSSQISGYGTFWLERLRDAWESCTHKKAAAAAAFTIFWNLSSIPARIWSVFMLAVAVRYYQQCSSQGWGYTAEDGDDGENGCDDEIHRNLQHHRQQQEPSGGCKAGRRPRMEPSQREQVVAKVAAMIAEQPRGAAGGTRQGLRGRAPSRLEMGSKEKRKV